MLIVILVGVGGILGLVVLGLFIYAIVTQWRESGPFRALTYGPLTLWVWGIYDDAKAYGARKAWLGFSKDEFAEMSRAGWKPTTGLPRRLDDDTHV